MTGDPVIAYPNGTLTGSIGVFFGKVNLKGLFDKVGIATETLEARTVCGYRFRRRRL